MFMPFIPFSVRFAQWYRAKQFAEGKAEGKAEVRAESIKLLEDRGFYAAAAALEALDREHDAPRGNRQTTER